MRGVLLSLLIVKVGIGLELPVKYDPFKKTTKLLKRTLKKKRVKKIKLSLEAIFNKKAYINGHLYKEGDKVGGGRVVKIGRDYVIIAFGKRRKVISLKRPRKVVKIKEANR